MNAQRRIPERADDAREDEEWLLILADPEHGTFCWIPAPRAANDRDADAGLLADDDLLSGDPEYLARCDTKRGAWIEAMERTAHDEHESKDQERHDHDDAKHEEG